MENATTLRYKYTTVYKKKPPGLTVEVYLERFRCGEAYNEDVLGRRCEVEVDE